MKFFSLYKTECKKLFLGKSFFVLSGIIFMFIILLTLAFELVNDEQTASVLQQAAQQQIPDGATADDVINAYEKAAEQFKAGGYSRFDSTRLNQFRSNVAAYKYIKEKGLPVKTAVFDSSTMILAGGAAGYLNTILLVTSSIVLFYSAILAAGGLMGEIKDGTVKLVLMRPVGRSTLFSAKYAALFSVSALVMLASVLVAAIYSMARFDLSAASCVVPFNGSSAFYTDAYGILWLNFTLCLFKNFAYTQFSYAAANVTSNKTAGILLPIALLLFLNFIIMFGGITYLGFVGFSTNVELSRFFGHSGMVFEGENFWISLSVALVWIAGLTWYNYRNFEKRDIN